MAIRRAGVDVALPTISHNAEAIAIYCKKKKMF